MQEISLITGGGSGIGRALAHKLANEGWKVINCEYLANLDQFIAYLEK